MRVSLCVIRATDASGGVEEFRLAVSAYHLEPGWLDIIRTTLWPHEENEGWLFTESFRDLPPSGAELRFTHWHAIEDELHPAYAQLAVDMGPVLQFEAPDWEILSGRPGTGKTFVLKAWEEQSLAAVGRPTILPLYVSARDMLDPPGEEDAPDQRAVAHFQLFLEKFGVRLKETTAAARAKESTVERLLGAGDEADRSSEESSHRRENVGGRGRMALRYSEIRGHVEDLAEILGIERFCVLLDQWSLIDPKVQPAVAELLVRALGGSLAITFKIAANPSQVNLFDDERQHGFRVDHDLIEAPDLDKPRMSEEALVEFYEEMVFNRLCYLGVDPELFLEDRSGRPSAEFIETLFQTREAFEILVKGAEGVSHSFLLTFRRLAEAGLPPDGWSVAEAREAIGLPEAPVPMAVKFSDVFQNVRRRVHLRPVVVATESRLFLVRREDREVARAPLEELSLLGLIEQARHDVLPRGLEQYDPYWLRRRALPRLRPGDPLQAGRHGARPGVRGRPRSEEAAIESEKDALRHVVDFSRLRA